MAFHQFSRLDGAPLSSCQISVGYLFIFLLLDENQRQALSCSVVLCAGISSHVRKGWTVVASSSFCLFHLGLLSISLWGPWRNGRRKQDHHSQCGAAPRLLASPAGFGRVVYFSLCVRALCSFGRGYNQPAEKEKKNRKKKEWTKETHQQEPPMYIDTQCSHICTQRDRKRDTVTW